MWKNKKSIILLVLLLFCWLPAGCFAEEAAIVETQYTLSSTELTELQTIIDEQDNLLSQLQTKLETSQTDSEQLAVNLETYQQALDNQQQQLTILQGKLRTAQNSLTVAGSLITTQNQSLQILSKDIKTLQKQQRREIYQHTFWGIVGGYVLGKATQSLIL